MIVISDEQFVAIWNEAGSVDRAAERVRERSGKTVPRWAVLARAIALRLAGVDLKRFEQEAPMTRPARPPVSPPPGPRLKSKESPKLRAAHDLAVRLMAQHKLDGWAFGFNNNVRRAGVCRYPRAGGAGRIELSRHFVENNTDDEVRDTILHEIAHALAGPDHGHDEVWRAKCREIGAKAERCYGGEVAMPKGRWRAVCGACSREYDRHRRPAKTGGWYCKACGPTRGALRWQEAG